MSEVPPLRRLAVEGLVIVGSILLAFSVDAWWDRQGDREDQLEVLRAVESEFQTYETVLVGAVERLTVIVEASEGLIDALRSVPEGGLVAVPESQVVAVLEWPTLRIPSATVELAGVVDPELGSLIRQWQAEVRTTVDRFDAAREMVFLQIRPELAPDLDLARLDRQAADLHLRGIEPAGGTIQIRRTSSLMNALSGRASLLYGALLGTTRLSDWITEIDARLMEELGS